MGTSLKLSPLKGFIKRSIQQYFDYLMMKNSNHHLFIPDLLHLLKRITLGDITSLESTGEPVHTLL